MASPGRVQDSILANLANVKVPDLKLSGSKVPVCSFPSYCQPPDRKLQDYLKGLLPVHSCSIPALKSILEDGALVSRAAEATRKSGDAGHTGIFEQLKERHNLQKLQPVLSRLRCRCEHCVNLALNIAEVDILAHRFGDTWAGRIRREVFMDLLLDWNYDGHYSEEELKAAGLLTEASAPPPEGPEREALKQTLASISTIAKDLAKSMDPPGFGIRFWVDDMLGLSNYNYAVLGPNVDYGPISLIFDASVLYGQCGDSDMIVNAAACFCSGAAYELRPWSVSEKFFETKLESNMMMYFKHLQYSSTMRARQAFEEQMQAVHEVVNSYRVAGLHVNGSLDYFANEIFGQAHLALSGATLDIDLVDAEEKHKRCRSQRGTTHRKDGKKGLIAASVPQEKESIRKLESLQAIGWYESVNVHGRVEVHLPTKMSLEKCLCAVIVRSERFACLDAETLAKLKRVVQHVVVVDGESEALEFQKRLFRIRAGLLPAPNMSASFVVVKMFTGSEVRLRITSSSTVKNLKQQLQEKEGTPMMQQRLVWNGSDLDDNSILEESGITKDSILYLVLKQAAEEPGNVAAGNVEPTPHSDVEKEQLEARIQEPEAKVEELQCTEKSDPNAQSSCCSVQ